MPIKFRDTPARYDPENKTFSPSQRGAFSILGEALGGVAAPFAGDFDYALKQAKLQQERDAADLDFQKYIMASSPDIGKPVFTIDELGQLKSVGMVPKGSQVLAPTTMQTPEQRANTQIATASRKEANVRANKLKELRGAIDFFEAKIGEVPGGKGISGRVKGLQTAVEAGLQTNPQAAAYKASVDGLRSQITRGLGEVGNLSEYEQRYAVRLLPQITDNLETRQQKLKNFRDYINKKLENSSRSESGGFEEFTVNGKKYRVPADRIDAFKKAKGIK